MNGLSSTKFTTSIQKEILKRFIEIESCIISFQTIFSVPSLLMFAAHFSCCSAVLGLVVTGTFLNMPRIYIIYHTTSIFNSLSFLMASMWFAGGVPLAMDNFKAAFSRKTQENLLLVASERESVLGRGLYERPSLVLSGCGILFFTRNSMLVVLGTLLTYTILLLSNQ
ncbi:hypothetical protein JTE90_025582 [Oedothorax gibbosus]|uniref:Uncharacterized protein n=1 Tax=Oedothorax gibbosus TaxID=931172 RepID=A0AAV6U3T7_9ARAC|nr:hypothetical protein JTE90_025581 [Oedothorax gibbosus]KAG8178659.1 hypothetical protein JTE90_025582 [Oedothorax gibbosus]